MKKQKFLEAARARGSSRSRGDLRTLGTLDIRNRKYEGNLEKSFLTLTTRFYHIRQTIDHSEKYEMRNWKKTSSIGTRVYETSSVSVVQCSSILNHSMFLKFFEHTIFLN